MKDQNDGQEQNQNNCTQFEDRNGIDLGIRKQLKLDGMAGKTSIDSQYNFERVKEQQKQVLMQIKHLASQGSHMQVTNLPFDTYYYNCSFLQLIIIYIVCIILFFLAPDIWSSPQNKLYNTRKKAIRMHQQMKFYQSKCIHTSYHTTPIYLFYFLNILLSKFLPPNSITPLIFTKKLPSGGQYRQKGQQQIWVNAFEGLLSVVVQLYYKSDQKLAEFMKEKVLIDSKKDIKQEKKPGRKKKTLDNDSPNQEQIEIQPNNSNAYSLLQQDVLDILISPLRNDFPFETWTTKEIAIFECGLCRYGKQYEFLAQLIKTKNAQDIIQFYYFWKFTSHYKLWKINKAYYHRSNLNNYV